MYEIDEYNISQKNKIYCVFLFFIFFLLNIKQWQIYVHQMLQADLLI
jgi:hypothetical protein